MMPHIHDETIVPARRHFLRLLIATSCGLVTIGCNGWMSNSIIRGQNPDTDFLVDDEIEKKVKLVGDLTSTWGLNYLKVESVALVTGLPNTGSDPPPSPQRATLLAEMQSHDVDKPNQILASPQTSMVICRGFLPPGCQKGDSFDVEVRVPPRSETGSLRGGWLMQTRMREHQFVSNENNTVKTGHIIAIGQGPVIVDAVYQASEDKTLETRGRVLSGAKVMKARPMGLVVKKDFATVQVSTIVGAAVNNRFHTFDRGLKTGVAEPKNNEYVELKLHPRYKGNISRFIRVIRSIAVNESVPDRAQRMMLLEHQIMNSTTAPSAALQLEAIGKEGITLLNKGLRSDDPESRFYAAEALAYLDQGECVPALLDAAKLEPAYRWHAITALAAMDHTSAYSALNELMHVQSAETRYGAFRALRSRNSNDPIVKGEMFHSEYTLHVIPSPAERMIHFTQSSRPEVALFGEPIEIKPTEFIFAGKKIVVKRLGENELRVSRFESGKDDEVSTCSTRLDDVIRTVAKHGGKYEDVLQLVHEGKRLNFINARVVVDALPSSSRLQEEKLEEQNLASNVNTKRRVANPLPDLFTNHLAREAAHNEEDKDPGLAAAAAMEQEADIAEEASKKRGFWGKMNPMTWWE